MRFAKTLDRDREISFEVPNDSHSQETKFQNSALQVLPCQLLILDFFLFHGLLAITLVFVIFNVFLSTDCISVTANESFLWINDFLTIC